MVGQQTQGQPGGVQNGRRIEPERVGKIALAAAGVVFVGSVVFAVFSISLQGGSVDFGDIIVDQLDDIPYQAAVFGAVLWATMTHGSKDALLKGSAIVYVGDVVNNILVVVTNEFAETGLGTLLGPGHAVLFFLGFVMAIRLYHGKNILPGVGVRL
ncbi:hypothetical protein [Halorientalis regularis]|jgi:hypothetical protein|uniref:Uncharacterized protein n=1 Tax=Halorientalis regularis TaxID=660518 RepID=A0A1G7INR2_9EURY|nr:hypothetical protein [Halorientalis regularis]SDF14380.1 hypothetical protein SAMN05216218_10426 [Halorientalis regularis]